MESGPNPQVDVLIVGAGISGIAAGYWLDRECPDRSWEILEGRRDLGGTWDLFRYPGIRSDSDMHTLGFSFKPWTDPQSIADGPAILAYLHETAREFDIVDRINFEHQVVRAEWDSVTATWTVHARVGPDQTLVTRTCRFLFMCSGYYSYRGGYTPEFAGRDRFGGQVVHPQDWPEDLDYRDKHVVVIGSGATAVTLVPAMADDTASITMLQRSPTYMVDRPRVDKLAQRFRKVFPEPVAYELTRRKNAWRGEFFYQQTRKRPDRVRDQLLGLARKSLGSEEVEANFTPTYNPWDQRLCLLPDGDFFDAVGSGKAKVVTDTIDTFTETGIQLSSGDHLRADIIVTATGLQLVTVGDMDFVVDGNQVDFSKSFTYRGIGYSDVPNMMSTFGYINASWTLRADLVSRFVCRVLNHMADSDTVQVTPRLRPADRNMEPRPWVDDFSSGYMARMMPLLPRQGDRDPWTNPQRYSTEKKTLLKAPLDDGALVFRSASVSV